MMVARVVAVEVVRGKCILKVESTGFPGGLNVRVREKSQR